MPHRRRQPIDILASRVEQSMNGAYSVLTENMRADDGKPYTWMSEASGFGEYGVMIYQHAADAWVILASDCDTVLASAETLLQLVLAASPVIVATCLFNAKPPRHWNHPSQPIRSLRAA